MKWHQILAIGIGTYLLTGTLGKLPPIGWLYLTFITILISITILTITTFSVLDKVDPLYHPETHEHKPLSQTLRKHLEKLRSR